MNNARKEKESKRAEEAALKAYPEHSVLIRPARRGGYYADNHLREGFITGYQQAEEAIVALIESRVNEILGDAQPKPALRAELRDLIKRITQE